MEEYIFDLTLKIRSQKKGMTTTQVNYFVITFVIKLCGVNTENHFLIQNYL